MVEPRYDQLSTEGAFSGNLERRSGACGDCAAMPLKDVKNSRTEDFSLWAFRKILKDTPLIGAGGYCSDTARQAILQGVFGLSLEIRG
jgi:12-oxophytodienoic acid reductase